LEDIKLDKPKTKEFSGILKNLSVDGKKTLFVFPEFNDNVYLSLRNLEKVNSALLSDINTYDIVNADVLVISESAAKVFGESQGSEE
jgi:large subunit ribosomal protein L4